MNQDVLMELQTLMERLYRIITITGEVNGFRVEVDNNKYAIPILGGIIQTIRDVNINEIDENDIPKFVNGIKSSYYSMFPPKSGLSEFYVWAEDYNTRRMINEEFSRLDLQIRSILKDKNKEDYNAFLFGRKY